MLAQREAAPGQFEVHTLLLQRMRTMFWQSIWGERLLVRQENDTAVCGDQG